MMITTARKTSKLEVFYLLKSFLEKFYFLFKNMCLKFGKDMTFVSGMGIFLFFFCFGLGFFFCVGAIL